MTQSKMTFAQGLQLFFIEKILTEKYTMGTEARSRRGIEFFSQWSRIVREGRNKEKAFPLTIKVPGDFDKNLTERYPWEERTQDQISDDVTQTNKAKEIDLSFAPVDYHSLLKDSKFTALLNLLKDEDLGLLMQVEYASEAAQKLAETIGTTKDAEIIREAVANALRKDIADVTDEDYRRVTELSLRDKEVSDLAPLKALINLQKLNLDNTQVSDLAPLEALKDLQGLSLSNTPVDEAQVAQLMKELPTLHISRYSNRPS